MTASPPPSRHPIASPRREDGISLIVTLGVAFVSALLLVSAFAATRSEIHLTSVDTAEKRAYYAAEAGVEDYEYHLTQDGNYLSYCTEPPSENKALNQVGSTTHRAQVPGTEGETFPEEYAIQLLPAESAPAADRKCDPNHLVETMLEEKGTATGTFRIEATGYAGGKERTLVATFRNTNFVSFVWYTKYETADPSIYGAKEEPNYIVCGQFYGVRPSKCSGFNNYFITGESVNGPMHTEDHAGICGSPILGRSPSDLIEFGQSYNKDEGYSNETGCAEASKPVFEGTHVPVAEVRPIEPPPGDEELKHVVEAAYTFKEKTEIVLEGSEMTIIEHVGSHPTAKEEEENPEKKKEVKRTNVPFPPNGVIYIEGGCGIHYSPFGPSPTYTQDTTCGNVYVHGYYTSSLTIASENDIVINGNITTETNEGVPTSNAMLGLIANNFVRIYHPLTGTREASYTKCGSASNDLTATKETPLTDLNSPTIYAAILAVKHAVIVDNFDCGKPTIGPLKIYGAVAGLFSNGMTGTFSGTSAVSGYPYDLEYDDRLQDEEPPHFLNPIEASWTIQRQTLAPNP
jgi:Tfp pilus assembly protein PilX